MSSDVMKNALEVESIFEFFIVKKPDGYYIISEDKKKILDGPFKSKIAAQKRLKQIEWFKRKSKKKFDMKSIIKSRLADIGK
jgi:hypothetical protein